MQIQHNFTESPELDSYLSKFKLLSNKKDFFKSNNFKMNFDISKMSYNEFKSQIDTYYPYYYSYITNDVSYFDLQYNVLQDDDNIFMIKINNLSAMLFFGYNRGWCVSDVDHFGASEVHTTFQRYLKKGYTFFIYNKKTKSRKQKTMLLFVRNDNQCGMLKCEFNWEPKGYEKFHKIDYRGYLDTLTVNTDMIDVSTKLELNILHMDEQHLDMFRNIFKKKQFAFDVTNNVVIIIEKFTIDKSNHIQFLEIQKLGYTIRFHCDVVIDITSDDLSEVFNGTRGIFGNLDISKSKLKSLNGCPLVVGDFLCCDDVSLEFGPKVVNGDLYCTEEQFDNRNKVRIHGKVINGK